VVKERRGTWVADWRDDDGRRYWKSFDTQEAANIYLGKVVERLKRGTFRPPAEIPTFATVAGDWLADKASRVRVSTYAAYQVHIEDHLKALGALRVDTIRVKHLEVLRDERLEAGGLAPQTVNKVLTTATAIFAYAARHEYVDRNPAEHVERCRRHTEEVAVDAPDAVALDEGQADPTRVLSIEQARAMVAHAPPRFYQTYLLTAVLTGARVGELTGVTWADVDLDAGKLRIRRSVSWAKRRGQTEAEPRFYKPKTKHSVRAIPMRPELTAALKRWRLQCPKKEQNPHNLVFPSSDGRPKHRSTITHEGLRPALEAAKLPRVGLHSLRHTFASTLLMAGRTAPEVAKLCGHAGPDVTNRVYAHWLKGDQHAEALDALGGGGDVVANGSSKP
jgi:integrase